MQKIKPIKHVPIGMTFTAVSHTGRIIPLGKVMSGFTIDSKYPHACCWYDENGKHYERFNLNNPGQEFREFKVIHPKEVA